MPALTRPTAYHAVYTVSETGLIFCANGETFDYGWVVLQPVYTYTANENWSRCESREEVPELEHKPDGTGKTYANGETFRSRITSSSGSTRSGSRTALSPASTPSPSTAKLTPSAQEP